jgi:hypothetical protein
MFMAKLKGRRGECRVIFSDDADLDRLQFYQPPAITNARAYNPDENLEDDEWWCIELDEAQRTNMVGGYYEYPLSSADTNPIGDDEYKNIEALYLVRDTEILFTKITERYRIRNKRFIRFDGDPQLDEESNAVEFTGRPDAYYDGSGRLYFQNFSTIRPLFPGIEDFFRVATREEKETFLGKSFFAVEGIDPDKIGIRYAKRIAAVLADASLNLDDAATQQKLRDYSQRYQEVGVNIDDNKLVIRTNKDLSNVLNLLSGRYYMSELTGEKMVAQATTKINESE